MAKKPITSTFTYKIPPSSYAIASAEYLLQKFNAHLTKADISQQLQDNQSFYKRLLKLLALQVYNTHVIAQCNELRFFCQEQLVNIIFAKYNLANFYKDKPVLSAHKEASLEQMHQQLDKQTDLFHLTKDTHNRLTESCELFCKEKVTQWQNLVEKHTDILIAKLEQQGVSVSAEFRARLLQGLERNGRDIEQVVLNALKKEAAYER